MIEDSLASKIVDTFLASWCMYATQTVLCPVDRTHEGLLHQTGALSVCAMLTLLANSEQMIRVTLILDRECLRAQGLLSVKESTTDSSSLPAERRDS